MKRISSIICIILLIGITSVVPYYSTSYFVYAEETSTASLDDQQKSALAISTYMNYRKGYFVGSSIGTVALVKSYIDEFFVSSSNNTGINSYSELANTITCDNSSGKWKVNISNQGIVFFDNLLKWLLGKDKFPNLYSGGAWGVGPSVDTAYNGLIYGNDLFYYIKTSAPSSFRGALSYSASIVEEGSPADGLSVANIVNYIERANNTGSLSFAPSSATSNINQSTNYYFNTSITVNYYSDWSYTYNNFEYSNYLIYSSQFSIDDYCPYLRSSHSQSGNGNDGFLGGMIYSKNAYGVPCRFAYQSNAGQQVYSGWVAYSSTENKFVFTHNKQHHRSTVPDVSTEQINLNTNGFNHDDIGDEDNQDAPSQEFTPQYTNNGGDTYNYYTNDTVNNFYNDYINNYSYNTNNTYNKTIVIKEESQDPEDPEDPVGGNVPDWSGGGGSGTITPDGNGGYTFELPDFSLPDLNIDWSISGLTEKFPFSIPFDLLAFFTVLNAEPETPAIEATIPLGIWEWQIDWDLHQFDSIAALMRNLEFIGFCIGLALITRNIIRG